MKIKYQATAIDLRQIADEIFETHCFDLIIPYPIYLCQEDCIFIENHMLERRSNKEFEEEEAKKENTSNIPKGVVNFEGIYDPK